MTGQPVIPNKEELREMVANAMARTQALATEDPASKLPLLIYPQLEFIAQHLDRGTTPAYLDRQRINIGPVAAKNFEEDEPEYARWLKMLNYAVKRWEQIPGISAVTGESA